MSETPTGAAPAAATPTLATITAELETIAAKQTAAPPPVGPIVDLWVTQVVFNSPIARDSDAINYFLKTALPALKQRLGA